MNIQEKLQKAIKNNIDLYEAIFRPHNIISSKSEMLWSSLQQTPPFYSNLVTLSPEWEPDNTFEVISQNYEKEKWSEWSIKDSFATLDLNKYGFKKLFNAQWIYLAQKDFIARKDTEDLEYTVIKNASDLSDWRMAWNKNAALGKQIFGTNLLNDPNIYFITGQDKGRIISGCLVNKTIDVLGLSNFFAPTGDIKYWSDIINFIFEKIEHLDIVGYEDTETVNKLGILGFEPLGNLAVWLKARDL